MIKSIKKLDSVYKGELFIDDETKNNISIVWNDFIKDKNPEDFFDGDIYCVTDIDDSIPSISFSKTKYSSLIYARQINNLIVRSLFSAGYIKTIDNYICIILDKRNRLNTIGGMASSQDIQNNEYDHLRCFVREFNEELGINLSNDANFIVNLKYLKYPTGDEIQKSFYPVGTLYEVSTSYSKDELLELFQSSNHDTEIKELKFYNVFNYKEVFSFDIKTEYLDELFKRVFEQDDNL